MPTQDNHDKAVSRLSALAALLSNQNHDDMPAKPSDIAEMIYDALQLLKPAQ